MRRDRSSGWTTTLQKLWTMLLKLQTTFRNGETEPRDDVPERRKCQKLWKLNLANFFFLTNFFFTSSSFSLSIFIDFHFWSIFRPAGKEKVQCHLCHLLHFLFPLCSHFHFQYFSRNLTKGESRHGSEGNEEKAQEERRHGRAAMRKAS